MFFIVNMVVCDVFVGIYFIIIGDLNIFNFLFNVSDKLEIGEKFVLGGGVFCLFVVIIFILVVCVVVVIFFLFMVEKYCFIVYCMNFDYCLIKKIVMVWLLFLWVLLFSYVLFFLFYVLNLFYCLIMMCSFLVV